ncbi:hypothetical protein GCK32_002967 [Trichostrongylus colubriformis]|uniref:Uncharacterized protein n=1 Tax=Trichostrongylus colubriformis TaxID=6319 RepID=A0AAN8FHV6_TRICO
MRKLWFIAVSLPILLSSPVIYDSDPQVWYCSNSLLKSTIETALSNPQHNVDEIQAFIESSLLSYFNEHNGKWLISVSKFHRLSGYVDSGAENLQTFCAIHDNTKDIHIVVVKVE